MKTEEAMVLLLKTIPVVRKAGDILLQKYSGKKKTSLKGAYELITKADYDVEQFLKKQLQIILPNSSMLAEESELHEWPHKTRPTWIVDPLDGTTNFVHRYPYFAVSVALLAQGNPVLGVILNPISGELFYAVANNGAYLNGRRIRVSSVRTLENSIIGFGFPYDRSKVRRVLGIAESILAKCRDLKRRGPASLDIAYVAAGRLDAYFEPDLRPWDYAAGVLILREARGKVTTWEGHSVTFGPDPSNILASNGLIHQILQQYFNQL